MALSDITVPYEILIRFAEDGTPRGAHMQRRRIIDLDGERLKDDVLPAEPLPVFGLSESGLMTDVTAAALRRVTELEGIVAGLQADLGAAQARVADFEAAQAVVVVQDEALA